MSEQDIEFGIPVWTLIFFKDADTLFKDKLLLEANFLNFIFNT